MAQAAAVMGLDIGVLKAAKRAGCKAFRGTRVWCRELRDWLKANEVAANTDAGTIAAAKLQKVREEVRRLKLANDMKAGTVIDRAVVAQALGKLCAEWNAIRTRAEAEAPAKMAGLEPDQCRVVFRGVMDDIGRAFAECARFFSEDSTTPTND